MHEIISFDHRLIRKNEASIQAVSSAALYGRGVFTTIAVKNGRPFLWEKHWRRLCENADRLGIPLHDLTEIQLKSSLIELLAANNVVFGRARITVFEESSHTLWRLDETAKTSVLIITGKNRTRPETLRLTSSPYLVNSTSPLVNIKSCNYLEHVMALDEARGRHFDEAVRFNQLGEIVSACMANIFWRKDGLMFTPALETGCLAGTTREWILERGGITETRANIDSLNSADAIFLTSSGLGVSAVKEFNGRKLQTTVPPQLDPEPAVHP